MLQIKSCVDKPVILPYCKRCRLPYSEAFYLYRALDGDRVLASALFRVGADQVDVLLYETEEPGDHVLFDAVLRAGLNYADRFSISRGYVSEEFREIHARLFEKINFPTDPVFNITNFFSKYKNCLTL